MCLSPKSDVVRRAIELKYGAAQRATALRWLLLNGALLAVLLADLARWCGACWPPALWAEALLAAALLASCARHALRLAPRRPAAAPLPLSPRQRDLLGLTLPDLDGSFVSTSAESPARASPSRGFARVALGPAEPGELSPPRRWRGADSPSPSPPTALAPSPPARRAAPRAEPGEFISDASELAAFIRHQEARASDAAAAAACACSGGASGAARGAYQLSTTVPSSEADASGEEAGTGGGGAPLWRRLQLDPQRLTEYNQNLRLWLHASVLGRVARLLAATGGAPGVATLPPDHALTPFLKPFADRQYVAERIAELARGGCLSAYRWNGGGREWEARGGRPSDAELLLHLLAAYLDLLAPAGDFSARHLVGAGAAGGPAPRAPALRCAALHPPHYVLLLGDETVELPPGRNNLLHTLLLFLAALARESPPALCRLHLGPAGLNMLWILGR